MPMIAIEISRCTVPPCLSILGHDIFKLRQEGLCAILWRKICEDNTRHRPLILYIRVANGLHAALDEGVAGERDVI